MYATVDPTRTVVIECDCVYLQTGSVECGASKAVVDALASLEKSTFVHVSNMESMSDIIT